MENDNFSYNINPPKIKISSTTELPNILKQSSNNFNGPIENSKLKFSKILDNNSQRYREDSKPIVRFSKKFNSVDYGNKIPNISNNKNIGKILIKVDRDKADNNFNLFKSNKSLNPLKEIPSIY